MEKLNTDELWYHIIPVITKPSINQHVPDHLSYLQLMVILWFLTNTETSFKWVCGQETTTNRSWSFWQKRRNISIHLPPENILSKGSFFLYSDTNHHFPLISTRFILLSLWLDVQVNHFMKCCQPVSCACRCLMLNGILIKHLTFTSHVFLILCICRELVGCDSFYGKHWLHRWWIEQNKWF